MVYKKYCCNCKTNYTTDERLLFFRCFNCREKIPISESIRERLDLFDPYIYSSNNNKDSSKIWLYSQAKLLWYCEHGHEFRQSPKNILDGAKCKKCLPGKNFKSSNSLRVKFPKLAKEWDYEKNIFTPSDYSFGSTVKVWWNCNKCFNNWRASIRSRTNKSHANGCPKCAELAYRSNGEVEVEKYIKRIYEGRVLTNVRNVISNRELDIYLPELNIAIEYNGDYWHSNKYMKDKHNKSSFEYHYEKYMKCHNKNIELVYIWESDWRERAVTVKHLLKTIIEELDIQLSILDYSLLQKLY